jgi:hypothetical protein
MTATVRHRFNPWMWLPLLVIGAAAIPNLVLILMARQAHISKVEDHPWLAAGRIDHDKELAVRFGAAGHTLVVEGGDRRIVCRITGPGPAPESAFSLHCYRASDASLDRRLPWTDPSRPLEVELPVGGRWDVRLLDGQSVVAAQSLSL